MKCFKCGGEKTKVVFSTPVRAGRLRVRIRKCLGKCGEVFDTVEVPVAFGGKKFEKLAKEANAARFKLLQSLGRIPRK